MKILVATDGSENANVAIDFLRDCPMPVDTEVTLMTVIDKDVFGGAKPSEIIESTNYDMDHQRRLLETEQMLHKEANILLDEAENKLKDLKLVTTKLVKSGHPSREIIREAERQSADMVMVGTHGHGDVKRFLLGSTSDEVMQYAPCSVLIVRNKLPGSDAQLEQPEKGSYPLKILLAFDNSPSARKATELCASLSAELGREITALTVMPLVHMYRQDVSQELSWLWKERKKIAEQGLDWVVETLSPSKSKVTTLFKEGTSVTNEILDTAEEIDSDLIVIGDKGESAIKRFLLGSTTWRIAHHAPCSVLTVRQCQQSG